MSSSWDVASGQVSIELFMVDVFVMFNFESSHIFQSDIDGVICNTFTSQEPNMVIQAGSQVEIGRIERMLCEDGELLLKPSYFRHCEK